MSQPVMCWFHTDDEHPDIPRGEARYVVCELYEGGHPVVLSFQNDPAGGAVGFYELDDDGHQVDSVARWALLGDE